MVGITFCQMWTGCHVLGGDDIGQKGGFHRAAIRHHTGVVVKHEVVKHLHRLSSVAQRGSA